MENEKMHKDSADELLYLIGQGLEINKMEQCEESHEFSDAFQERQRAIMEKFSAGGYNLGNGNKRRFPGKKRTTIMVAAVLIAGLAVTAGASSNFSFRDFLVDREIHSVENDKEGVNYLSHALEGTNEYKACQEWSEFWDANNGTQEKLEAIKEVSQKGLPEGLRKYSAYGVIRGEEAEKVDEISEKYGLKILGEPLLTEDYNQILQNTGIDDFVLDKENIKLSYARTFEEGNFNGDFEVILDEEQSEHIRYIGGISVNRNGVFGDLILNMGDLSDYVEWEYLNGNKDKLNLMINYVTKHSYIFYKGSKNFVIINMSDVWDEDVFINDSGGYINVRTNEAAEGPRALEKEQLQRLADMINFSVF